MRPADELMIVPADPHSHFDAPPDKDSQILVCALNYSENMYPTYERLIRLQEWVRTLYGD